MLDHQARREKLGQALRRIRKSRGLTIFQVARLMGNKASAGTQVSRWELGQVAPSADRLWAFLDALGLTFADLEQELNPTPATDPVLEEIAEQIRRLP